MGRIVAALLVVGVGACLINVDYSGTEFLCSDGVTCPDGKECIEGVCRDPGFIPPDAAVDGPPALDPQALVGDLLTYSFDTVQDLGNQVLDGSGNRFHAHRIAAALVEGRFGRGLDLDSTATTRPEAAVSNQAELFTGNTLTIEMWLRRDLGDVSMPLFGDIVAAGDPPVTYQLDIGADNNLAFTTNSGCPGEPTTVVGPSAAVPVGVDTHVAVTWDGANLAFYIDGAHTDTLPLTVDPCSALPDRWFIGARDDDAARFDGMIDEFKFSSYAKSDREIAESMSHDTTGLNNQCGNGVVIAGQSCEPGGLCCDDMCAPLADGAACELGSADLCSAGVCDVGGGRTADGLIALYLFDEGAGTTVADSSGVGTAVDLTIGDDTLVTWNASSLTISEAVAITSVTPAAKIINSARGSNAISVEAWVTPANIAQAGPARIVSLSEDTALRNFTLGQEASAYVGRVRSTSTNLNGQPASRGSGIAATALTHVVMTSGADGTRRVYVDGVLTGVTGSSGVFTNWDTGYQLVLGDELTANRLWTGEIHLVAIYDRELSGDEVAASFLAGVD